MVPDIAGKGHSFAGAMRYYLHDKRQPGQTVHPTTSERVAWTETRNLAGVEDARLAMRLMIATACQAEDLKRRAGVKASGRRSSKSVYAFSLSWHPDEAAGLDRAEMLRAADSALKALDASHLQCVIVCHRDQPHPHVHVILNRVDPEDGRMAVLSKDRERLSKWAHDYERERGPLLTPKRAEKYGPEAERQRQARAVSEDGGETRKRQPSQRAMLAQLDAAQRERHAQEWQALDGGYQAERKAILEKHPAAKTILAEYRRERQAAAAALETAQARDMAALEQRTRSLFGRLRNALDAAKEAGEPGGRLQLVKRTIGFALSPEAVRQQLAEKQQAEREAQAKAARTRLTERVGAVKATRTTELTALAERFGKDREQLIARQNAEKTKMKEAWRAAPQPERSKRTKTRAESKESRAKEIEREARAR
jgi:hypothetical protein